MDARAADVEQVLAAKTVRDPASLELFLAAVRSLGKDGGDFTAERLQDLVRVEEHFRALLLYDQIEFLRQPGAPSGAERDFALNVQRVLLELANGFQRFLRNRAAWATSLESIDLAFRITGLALISIHAFVKWGYFLGDAARPTPWKQLHALYSLAEVDGYTQAPFALNASQEGLKTSVQTLYIRTLVLDVLHTGSLTKVQTEIADGWFSAWCEDYALDTEYSSRSHLFFVDLASTSGLQLMQRDSHGDTLRYLRADALKAQIDEVQAGLRQGRPFAGHGSGALFPVEEHVALLAILEKLYHSILAGSEKGIEERTHFQDREVDVVLGIERVLRKMREATGPQAPAGAAPTASVAETIELSPSGMSLVAAPSPEAPAEAPADPDLERWNVHDLSSKGFGLLVEGVAAEQVPLNGILALRNHESGGWILATVVRKLANRVNGATLVGVEVLSYRPIAIELAAASGGASTAAIYLPSTEPNGKLDSIVVRVGEFRSDQGLVIKAGTRQFRVRLNRIIRKGADWIRARFEIEAKS
jgi:hypothetical protein